MKFDNKITNILAGFLLMLMLFLTFFSIQNDSLTMDELAHTPAGYSYISQKDMRLNHEHPPLLKDMAGLSVWLGSKITNTKINFPIEHKSWQEDLNGQWDFGREFLYNSNNQTDQIILFSRLPMILMTLLLGFYVFRWTRELYGNKAGLLALFLYSLSPAFLAHGRLVTTDVPAAAAFFIAAYYLIKWIQKPNKKNLIIAGLVFGLALLTKFSLVMLIPYFIFLVIVWSLLEKKRFPRLAKNLLGLLLIGLIAMALIWPVYQFHILNYPAEKQLADTETLLQTFGRRWMVDPVIWMADKPIIRAYGQFFFGFFSVMQRTIGGNTTYFLGEISRTAWPHYFPITFLIKVPLSFLILILISLCFAVTRIYKNIRRRPRLILFIKKYFTEFALISFFIFYWITSIKSNLNIGVRHVLPTFPILYILVSGQIIKWLKFPPGPILEKVKINSQGILKSVKMTFSFYLKTTLKCFVIIILIVWYAFGTITIYPHFITYFNELVGGPSQGYKYVTDSNLDWGQDLKRLAEFVEENNIKTIYVDYFGGDSPEFRLKEKYYPWWGDRDPSELSPNSWIAISATLLQGGRGLPNAEYNEKTGYYNWLNQYEPVTVIGNSIFVYQIP